MKTNSKTERCMMRKITRIVMLTICLIMLAGCSTVMNGPTQDIVVTSNPPGATIITTTFEWIKTPGTFKLPRNNSTTLTANLYGYETAKQDINCELSLWPIVSAIGELSIYPGLIFTTLDLSTGSVGHLTPNEVHFELVSKKKTIIF